MSQITKLKGRLSNLHKYGKGVKFSTLCSHVSTLPFIYKCINYAFCLKNPSNKRSSVIIK